MAEIAPNGKKRNQQEIKPHSKGIWNPFDHHSGGEQIHKVTEEMNRRSMLAPFRGGQVATP